MEEIAFIQSVKLHYGNHREEVIDFFLSRKWELLNEIRADYTAGDKCSYLTFKGGYYADPVNALKKHFNFVNATLL